MLRTISLSLLALGAVAFAQGPPPGRGPGRGPGMGVRILGAEAGRGGPTVKGAPYSGDLIAESSQTLADGNHIRQTTTARVYRDAEGRTRQEQSLSGMSAVTGSSTQPSMLVFIHDPVAHTTYALDPSGKTATSASMGPFRGNPAAPVPGAHGRPGRGASAPMNAKTETLARQNIEGVMADGVRTTMTIPAGQIGNDQPINIVTERWYSPELQINVLTRHSDPRTGETVTRLTNISRSEPSHTLFVVPPDYKLTEGGHMRPAGGPSKRQ